MMPTSYQNLAILFLIFIIMILLYFKWSYKYWKRRQIPYITPKIPYGNLENPFNSKIASGLQVANIYAEFKRKGWKQGGIFSVTRPIYMPVDLNYVKNVLTTDFQHFMDRGMYHNEKTDPLTAQIVRMEGQKWKNLRTKLTPVFTSGKIKGMFQTVLDSGEQMKQALDEMYFDSKIFDIKEIAACFTTDVIGSCAFGLDCNSFKDPDSQFRVFGRKLFGTNLEQAIRIFLTMSFPKLCKSMGMRFFPLDVIKFYSDLTNDVIEYRRSKKIERNDFVQLLLEIKGNKSEETLTPQEMIAQSFVFFAAGFETSSSTMSFCLYELAKNPDIQEKVRCEINHVTSKHGGKILYDGIQEMTYMTQVIEETLRMYPAALIINRICTKDYVLPGTNTILRKGTPVFVPVYGIHHDPEYYPNPKQFNPDRFSTEAKSERHSFAFLPFGEGPRICIGLRFAMIQTKVGLTILLRHYQFSLNSKTPQTLTINPKSLLISSVENIFLNVKKC